MSTAPMRVNFGSETVNCGKCSGMGQLGTEHPTPILTGQAHGFAGRLEKTRRKALSARVGRWKIYLDPGALPRLPVDADPPARVSHRPMRRAHPQSRPAQAALGAEERLENP